MAFHPSSAGLASLPAELLEAFCASVGCAPEGARGLAALSTTCRWMRIVASSPAIVTQVAVACGAPSGFSSLRLLDLFQTLAEAGGSHIDFDGACLSIAPGSQARLRRLAELMARHPGVTVRAEVHAGSSIAALSRKEQRAELQTSRERADAVASFLVARGVRADRVLSTAWGASVPEAVPGADLFFEFDGLVHPARPSHYDSAAAPPAQPCIPHAPVPAAAACPPSPSADEARSPSVVTAPSGCDAEEAPCRGASRLAHVEEVFSKMLAAAEKTAGAASEAWLAAPARSRSPYRKTRREQWRFD